MRSRSARSRLPSSIRSAPAMRRCFRACSKAMLLAAATNKWLEADARTDVERANALGCIHLVPDDGEQVNVKLDDIDGELADSLGGIGVQEDAVLMGDGGEFGDRLQHAGLIIGVHDRHQVRRLAQRCSQIGGEHQVRCIDSR